MQKLVELHGVLGHKVPYALCERRDQVRLALHKGVVVVLFLVVRDERWEGRGGGHAEKGRERREEQDNCLLPHHHSPLCRTAAYSPHHHSPLCRTAAYPVQDGWNGVEELVFLEVFKTGHHD